MRLSIIAIVAFCLCALSREARAEQVRYDWRLEDGFEYDTNPARTEHIAGTENESSVPGSPLARIVASGSLAAPLGQNNTLALSGALGGKCFFASDARAANAFVVQTAANDTLRLGQRTQVALSGTYYDVFQRRSLDIPDFRSAAPTLQLDQRFAKTILVSLGGGYRWFTFKPDDTYSFTAPTAFLAIRHLLPGDLLASGADWEWSAGGSMEERNFVGPACTSSGCSDTAGSPRHHDRFWIGHAEWSRTGSWLFGSGAALHINQSNSYGESLVRGLVHVRAVIPLPWELSLSVRGEVVVSHYADPLMLLQPVAGLPSASIEDESRSTFRLDIARLFQGNFEIGARYVIYTSAPASNAVDYRRQTLLFYFAFLGDRW
jgi:hypothetical protein